MQTNKQDAGETGATRPHRDMSHSFSLARSLASDRFHRVRSVAIKQVASAKSTINVIETSCACVHNNQTVSIDRLPRARTLFMRSPSALVCTERSPRFSLQAYLTLVDIYRGRHSCVQSLMMHGSGGGHATKHHILLGLRLFFSMPLN